MKKAYLFVNLIIAAVMLASFSAFGQTVPNGNFEAWDTGITYPRATGWDSPNEVIATSLFSTNYVITQETAAPASGTYSAKLTSKSISIPFGNPISVPGFMTLGDFNVNLTTQTYTITGGVPFTARPDKLTGTYMYAPTGSDVCLVQVLLFNYDPTTQTVIDTIGEGVFVGEAAAAYTSFEAEIDYNSSATPNYMNINILSSGSSAIQVGSTLYIDNLEFYTEPSFDNDLFFSEYVEGLSNNKALELYNPTSDTLELDNYRLVMSSNGGGWSSYRTFPAGAKLAPHDVWVLINSQTSSTLYPAANADEVVTGNTSIVTFNGNDARGIVKIDGADTLWLDVLGHPTVDPGATINWAVAGVAGASKDHTLVRKMDILHGNTTELSSFGTDSISSEWFVYAANDFSHLGSHNSILDQPELAILNPANNSMVYTADVTVDFITDNFAIGQVPGNFDGYVQYTLDGGTAVSLYSTASFTLTSLGVGAHQLIMSLVDTNGVALSPAVTDTTNFTIALNPEAFILSFSVAGQIGGAVIDNTANTVLAFVPVGTVLAGLIPTIDISSGASINPPSGLSQDFTNPVTYTVTAQSGAVQTWVVTIVFQPENDLFFSEYIEGTSNNKAFEIFNPTPYPISLDSYRIAQSTNGGGWVYYHTFPAGAAIAPGDVWVIVSNQFNTALFSLSAADEAIVYPGVVYHNGDDARALIKVTAVDTTWIDIIGVPTVDPGNGWDVAGVLEATKDHTLIRKPSITHGNADWALSAGTDSISSEWFVHPMDYVNLGSHYTGGNLPPVVSSVTLLPAAVTAVDTVIIAAQVTDTDGSVVSVTFDWGLDGTTYPNVMALTEVFGIYSIYPNAIPAHAQGTTVYFRFIATDNIGDVTTYNGSYTVAVDPTVLTISQIQGQVAASPYANVIVTTEGVVTALLPGTSQGYFIQDGAGAWNGVFVYDNVNLPALGDRIQITALVSEYYELTELKTVTAYSVLSTGNALPTPVEVTTLAVNDEQYESVLVKISQAECMNDDYGFGMWQVDDGSGVTLIHNNANFTFTPVLGTKYDVIGALNYTFSEWKIELRMTSDVVESVSIDENQLSSLNTYPNPVTSSLTISLNDNIESVELYNLIGAQVYSARNVAATTLNVDMSSLQSGVYLVKVTDRTGQMKTKRIVKQ